MINDNLVWHVLCIIIHQNHASFIIVQLWYFFFYVFGFSGIIFIKIYIFLYFSSSKKLPDQSLIIHDIQRLIDKSNLTNTVDASERILGEIKDGIENIIKSNVPEVKMAINKVGAEMQNISNQVVRQIDGIADFTGNNTLPHFNTADDYITQYSVYRYYAGLIISSVLLIILVFITFGLLCGICGKRPDGYGDDCCTKGAGARFLMWWVMIA